ncbi:MAG: hypothetical protein D6B27_08615, partial [Gammaproteobacteria bacterium]
MDTFNENMPLNNPNSDGDFGDEPEPIDLDAMVAIDKEQEKIRLPFAYAKRHKVLITDNNEETADVSYSDDTGVDAITEVRRRVGRKLKLTKYPALEFEQIMQKF